MSVVHQDSANDSTAFGDISGTVGGMAKRPLAELMDERLLDELVERSRDEAGGLRLAKPQRVVLHCWAFAQLTDFIAYKAHRAGVPLVFVDPAYTSQICCECDHTDKKNRVDQGLFTCRSCGVVAHADRNASHNIATRGETVWNAGRKSHVPPGS